MREIAKAFPEWSVHIRRGGHLKLTHPNGAIYFTAMSPSDQRAWRNLTADLRRLEGQP